MSDDRESSEEDAVRARDVELVGEMTDSNVIRVVVLVLQKWSASASEGGRDKKYLEILTGDLDLVEFLVLELDEPMRSGFQVASFRFLVEQDLVTIPPGLQSLHIVSERRFRSEEVLFEVSLREIEISTGQKATVDQLTFVACGCRFSAKRATFCTVAGASSPSSVACAARATYC